MRMLPRDLLFLRHAYSWPNDVEHRSRHGDHSGFTDTYRTTHTAYMDLHPDGQVQAERAGAWLRQEFYEQGKPFDRCIASTYMRTIKTAGLLDLPNAVWHPSIYSVEREWGKVAQFSYPERDLHFPGLLDERDREPLLWQSEHVDSLAATCYRCRWELADLEPYRDGRALIVCHGEVMWCYRFLIEAMTPWQFKELHLSEDRKNRGIWNCEIIHYTREDPETGLTYPEIGWMRRIRPTESPVEVGPWQTIVRCGFSSAELLEVVAKHGVVP